VSRSIRVAKGVARYFRFIGIRAVQLGVAVVIAVLLTIIIANIGGMIDQILETEIRTAVAQVLLDPKQGALLRKSWEAECISKGYTGEELRKCIDEYRDKWIEYNVRIEMEARGLDKPFIVRVFIYLQDALKLDLGRAIHLYSDTGSKRVWDIIIERLPATILLFTTANLIIFFIGLFAGLSLSRKYGSLLDKVAVSLAPLSSMPGWFYGLFTIMIFAFWLRLLPSGGMVDPRITDPFLRALDILRHMILPILSWMIAYVPIGVYSYRTFFLLFSTEEYVDYARARGVPPRIIERRYILRPTLPPIVTSFVLMLISSWMGAIITERVFRWPGLGSVLYEAISRTDPPVVIGIITIYAYLLAISVLALEMIYGIIDPRVRVGG
jgi:peptide/nickel transport system permease protein